MGTDEFGTIGLRWHAESLLRVQSYRGFVRCAARHIAKSATYYSLLPVDSFFDGRPWEDLQDLADDPSLAVLVDSFWRRSGNDEVNAYRRYAVEDLLRSMNLDRPTQLSEHIHEFDRATLVYFLSNVCVPEVLDLMATFPTSRSVQEERRSIRALLLDLDPGNADTHRDEITSITHSLILDDGMRLLDQSRVFVDKEGVVRWAERELRENFDRYRALQSAGVGDSNADDFAGALRKFLVNQEPIPGQFLSLPKSEADDLFLLLLTQLRENFLLSPTHGLDAFLSMRVRHGTLSGLLRGPLEQNHIVNQRISGTLRYQRSSHWDSKLFDMTSYGVSIAGLRRSPRDTMLQ